VLRANLKWKLITQIVGSCLVLVLAIGMTGCERSATIAPNLPDNTVATSVLATTDGPLSEVNTPVSIERLAPSLAKLQPRVAIISPQADRILDDDRVSVKFQVSNFPIFKSKELGLGNHLHVILDKQTYRGVYDLTQPLVFENLAPGTHTLRVFASRPWHESFKNPGAYAQTTFHVLTKTAENNPDPQKPLLTYSRPAGKYGAEPIMLDYFLTNAPTHAAPTEGAETIPDWKIRVTINNQQFSVDRWAPIYLQGFKPGKNLVKMELLDDRGNPIANVYNESIGAFDYDPQSTDSLSKLIQDKLPADLARSVVDPNYAIATTPAPAVNELVPTPTVARPSPSPIVTTPSPQPIVISSPITLAPSPQPIPLPSAAPNPPQQPITLPRPVTPPPQYQPPVVVLPSPAVILPQPSPVVTAPPAPSSIALPSPVAIPAPQPLPSPIVTLPPQPIALPAPVILPSPQPQPPQPLPSPAIVAPTQPLVQPTPSAIALPSLVVAPNPVPVTPQQPQAIPSPIVIVPQQPLPIPLPITIVPQPRSSPSAPAVPQPIATPIAPAPAPPSTPTPTARIPVPATPSQPTQIPIATPQPVVSPTLRTTQPPVEIDRPDPTTPIVEPKQNHWQAKAMEIMQFLGVKIRAFTNTIPAKAQRFGHNVQIWSGQAIDRVGEWVRSWQERQAG
jgi:hypothetical protein